MRFMLEIECAGSAFEPDVCADEVARLLRLVAERQVMSLAGSLVDANGNGCGTWWFDEVAS